jgi:Protein of unknown function (DUF2950)
LDARIQNGIERVFNSSSCETSAAKNDHGGQRRSRENMHMCPPVNFKASPHTGCQPTALEMAAIARWARTLFECAHISAHPPAHSVPDSGFALVAWPAEYDASGVMTFIVNQNGVVHETDLGSESDGPATAITRYDPDPSWKIVH